MGKPAATDRRRLKSLNHSLTLDILLGFIGPKAEAQQIKAQLQGYLADTLKLERWLHSQPWSRTPSLD